MTGRSFSRCGSSRRVTVRWDAAAVRCGVALVFFWWLALGPGTATLARAGEDPTPPPGESEAEAQVGEFFVDLDLGAGFTHIVGERFQPMPNLTLTLRVAVFVTPWLEVGLDTGVTFPIVHVLRAAVYFFPIGSPGPFIGGGVGFDLLFLRIRIGDWPVGETYVGPGLDLKVAAGWRFQVAPGLGLDVSASWGLWTRFEKEPWSLVTGSIGIVW